MEIKKKLPGVQKTEKKVEIQKNEPRVLKREKKQLKNQENIKNEKDFLEEINKLKTQLEILTLDNRLLKNKKEKKLSYEDVKKLVEAKTDILRKIEIFDTSRDKFKFFLEEDEEADFFQPGVAKIVISNNGRESVISNNRVLRLIFTEVLKQIDVKIEELDKELINLNL